MDTVCTAESVRTHVETRPGFQRHWQPANQSVSFETHWQPTEPISEL